MNIQMGTIHFNKYVFGTNCIVIVGNALIYAGPFKEFGLSHFPRSTETGYSLFQMADYDTKEQCWKYKEFKIFFIDNKNS